MYLWGLLEDEDTDPDDVMMLSPLLVTFRNAKNILESYFRLLSSEVASRGVHNNQQQPQETCPQSKRKALRRRRFRQAQKLYRTDRATLAQRIIGV